MSSDPILRHAARIVLLDEDGRVFLFSVQHGDDGPVWWFTAGGGIEPGEDARTAARRELEEETGRGDIELQDEIWHRRAVFEFNGLRYDQRERFFLAWTAHFTPDLTHLTDVERTELTGWRWFSADEIDASPDSFAPDRLAELLRSLLRDGPPPVPVDVS